MIKFVSYVSDEAIEKDAQSLLADIISEAMYYDLLATCPALKLDVTAGVVDHWVNVTAPGGRNRFLDLFKRAD